LKKTIIDVKICPCGFYMQIFFCTKMGREMGHFSWEDTHEKNDFVETVVIVNLIFSGKLIKPPPHYPIIIHPPPSPEIGCNQLGGYEKKWSTKMDVSIPD